MTRCMDTCCRPEPEVEVVQISCTRRRSRKTRRCGYCGDTINVGENYTRIVQKVDGEMSAWDAHYDDAYCLNR